MKRLRMDLTFENEDPLNDLVEEAVRRYMSALVINEGQDNEERGFFSLEDCHHDTGEPCEITDRWEAGRGKVI